MTITNKVTNRSMMPGITPISDVPDAPTIGTATAGAENASIDFTAAITGGAPTLYRAISSPDSIAGTNTVSPITVSGLTAGTAYTFTVRGENSTGNSAYSSASNQVTPSSSAAYIAIGTLSPTSGATATFSNIPQTYKHLQIRFSLGMSGGGDSGLYFRVNGDTSSNYYWHNLYFDGTKIDPYYSGSASDLFIANHAQNISPSSDYYPTVGWIEIMNYTSSQKKVIRIMAGQAANFGDSGGTLGSALWDNTSPITSLNFVTHGTYTFTKGKVGLFGIK